MRVEPAMTPETDYESIPFYKIKKPGMTPSTDEITGRVPHGVNTDYLIIE
ncbi:MAG: hypothetical protein H0V61_03775 [Chitinophagales bacterium]|nr:hypothetical protein [Chitinophagales bacterium]